MPLESRGFFDFEKLQSLTSPEGALGVAVSAFGVAKKDMAFSLIFDVVKK